MDNEIKRSESRQSSSANSSLRLHSLGPSNAVVREDDEIESQSVSEAGDIGDRAIHEHSSRSIFLTDDVIESRLAFSIHENSSFVKSHTSFRSSNANSLHSEIGLSNSNNNLEHVEDQTSETTTGLPQSLQYVSCLLHLAVFGILGVLSRYLLQKLFGPGVADVTSDHTIVYIDLPSNMVGSFLMGWFGVVFKGDIACVSDVLSIGLTTGYLGSLTTFSGWNQKMLDLSVHGHWVAASLGYLLGLFLVAFSLIFGVETAKGVRWLLISSGSQKIISGSKPIFRANTRKWQLCAMLAMSLLLCLLWGLSAVLESNEFPHSGKHAELWFACLVGPIGVWIRWFLARLNGRGLGPGGSFRWVPFGTLAANVVASCAMAGLATLKKAASSKGCETVAAGLQFGLLGCLSTVSTFIVEFEAMRQSKLPWRAYVYVLVTIVPSFALGTLFYSVPVWVEGYS